MNIVDFNFSLKGLVIFNNGYLIKENGDIYKNDKLLKQSINTQGYKVINIKDKNKKNHTCYVHHLVAYYYLNHKCFNNNLEIDHIDSNNLNNHKDNLQIISKNENLKKRKKRGCNKKKYKKEELEKLTKEDLIKLLLEK